MNRVNIFLTYPGMANNFAHSCQIDVRNHALLPAATICFC